MNSNIFCWIIFLWQASCTCELICPTAEIGSEVELICNHPRQTSTWIRFTSPSTAEASCKPICSSSIRFKISVVNKIQIRLTVQSVERRDEGVWRCKHGQEAEEQVTCNMNLYKIPTCHVSTDKATSVVSAGETVNLFLCVNNSYCTESNVFTLQTGQVEQNLTGKKQEIDSHTFIVTFNASETYFGNVSTTFTCGSQHNLKCSGVIKLMERDPPSYNISILRPTDSGAINDTKMTVSVEKYPCSGVSQYNLNVGNVQHLLSNDTNISVKTTLNLNLAEDHLEAKLNYICNSVNRTVSCTDVRDQPPSKGASYQEFPLYGILLLSAAILIVFIIATAIFLWKCPKWTPCNILNRFQTKTRHTDKEYERAVTENGYR